MSDPRTAELKRTDTLTEFDTGSKRSSNSKKTRIDLISPHFLDRLGHHMRKGAEIYDARNWEKGQNMSRLYESAIRHLVQYHLGMVDEDHLSAVAFNVMAMIHQQEMFSLGLLPKELDDLKTYGGGEK